jgi:uncharacterized protein YyaL (SSP411 family)
MKETGPHQYTNKLIQESSPYLLQHAHNPVDWHAWNQQTLEKAISEDKMMLISIGYSACHWCHVMEHQCFENEALARLMNDHFVCVKVDREERPDVDAVYMNVVQLINGNGGWPLNCFALPDGRPFYGGTYFPPQQWDALLKNIIDLYDNRRSELEEQAEKIMEGISYESIIQPLNAHEKIDELLSEAINKLEKKFDTVNGGSAGAPKFPLPVVYNFLLSMASKTKSKSLAGHIQLTLDKMMMGGIYDQIGGGFARYAVDDIWKVPHFEKMLYDNAQLISLYTNAFKHTNYQRYLTTAIASAGFVLNELTSPEGLFYCALDADSEGEEGKFYVWKKNEFLDVLKDDGALIARYYELDGDALWEKGNNVLLRKTEPEQFAESQNIDPADFRKQLIEANAKLLRYRNKRVRPGLDDKALTSWNALMISALTDLSSATDNERYINAALTAAEFIKNKLFLPQTGLFRNYKNNKASIAGFLEDYALMAEACIGLYQYTADEKWLSFATDLVDYAIENFYDPDDGLFWFTGKTTHDLVSRKKEIYDNVIPSSNSVMAIVIFKLSRLTGIPKYADYAEKMKQTMLGHVQKYPSSFSNWASFINMAGGGFYEIVIAGPQAQEMARVFNSKYLPNAVIAAATKTSDLPVFRDRFVPGKTLIYVCAGNYCKKPVETIDEAFQMME